jgi:hypothetical protein
MMYNRCAGIYKFGNNTYPRCIRRRSNLGHIFREKSASYGLQNTVIHINKPTHLLDIFHHFNFFNNTFYKMTVLVSGETTTPATLSPSRGVNICLDFVIHVFKFKYGYISASVKLN